MGQGPTQNVKGGQKTNSQIDKQSKNVKNQTSRLKMVKVAKRKEKVKRMAPELTIELLNLSNVLCVCTVEKRFFRTSMLLGKGFCNLPK